jgi:hypothetical protein
MQEECGTLALCDICCSCFLPTSSASDVWVGEEGGRQGTQFIAGWRGAGRAREGDEQGRLRGWGSASTASRSRSDWGRQIRSRGAARRGRVGEEGDLAARAVRAFWDRFALTRSWGEKGPGLAARVVGAVGWVARGRLPTASVLPHVVRRREHIGELAGSGLAGGRPRAAVP